MRHARAALAQLPDALVTPEITRLRAVPPSRLAAGASRGRLARVLATTPALWRSVRERAAEDAPESLAAWLRGEAELPARERGPSMQGPPARDTKAEVARHKERARTFQAERDEAVRQLEGAVARAEAAEERAATLSEELEQLRLSVAELEDRVREAEGERQRAVDRERRRGEALATSLREELRELRRRSHERQRSQREGRAPATVGAEPKPEPPTTVRAGRPSELPRGVRAGTREEAELLLGRGRRVLVDGYNVTRTHRERLSLEEQRTWLVRTVAAAVASRGIAPEIVFDGAGGAHGPAPRARGVRVTFTRDVTADDEIEFRVAALEAEEPVTVVTDDRELRERVRRYGADVIGTGPFLWVVG